MKVLYFDCSNGISGDMLLKAVSRLGGKEDEIYKAMEETELKEHHHHTHEHDHHEENHVNHGSDDSHSHDVHGDGHGRSYSMVKRLIANSNFSAEAKATAEKIYGYIAKAEAKVHEATLETVHFHEVGRDEAIKNALAIGMAVEAVNPDKILVSRIYDGKGTILCSHGEISVPVPAVMALRENCKYEFETADVDTEMVTPSGLAGLMGLGAEYAADDEILQRAEIVDKIEAKGSRQTGRPGLMAYILKI